MPECIGPVCGTGGWTGPLPGDPDNNVTLSANGRYGYVEVSWTYPSTNAYAVMHTLLYRSISADFATAIQIRVEGGNSYADRFSRADIRPYYYWIKLVSVNGTVGDLIGPASATPLNAALDTLEGLTGLIDSGVLAQALRTEIDRITLLDTAIADEALQRLQDNTTLTNAIAQVQTATGEAATYLQQEITQRTSENEALVQAINVIAAGLEGSTAVITEEQLVLINSIESIASDVQILYTNFDTNTAAILNEQTARSTADSATATTISTLVTDVAGNTAAIANEISARTTAVDTVATSVSTLEVEFNNDLAAAIQTEQTARATEYGSLATSISTLQATSNTTTAAVATETTARIDADTALAGQITTAESALNGNLASVQTSLQTNIDTVNGEVVSIGALYTAKVSVDGLIGGFGVYNDGSEVEAGFDVDRFWVGRTTNMVKPFIVNDDVVYLNKARIRDADIDTLKIAGAAVTVPVVSKSAGTYEGAHPNEASHATDLWNATPINRCVISLDSPGIVYAHSIASQWYGRGLRYSLLGISITDSSGKQERSIQGGGAVVPSPSVATSMLCATGLVTIKVFWIGEPGCRITDSIIFATGAKR